MIWFYRGFSWHVLFSPFHGLYTVCLIFHIKKSEKLSSVCELSGVAHSLPCLPRYSASGRWLAFIRYKVAILIWRGRYRPVSACPFFTETMNLLLFVAHSNTLRPICLFSIFLYIWYWYLPFGFVTYPIGTGKRFFFICSRTPCWDMPRISAASLTDTFSLKLFTCLLPLFPCFFTDYFLYWNQNTKERRMI